MPPNERIDCFSLLVSPWRAFWRSVLTRLVLHIESWPLILPLVQVKGISGTSCSRRAQKDKVGCSSVTATQLDCGLDGGKVYAAKKHTDCRRESGVSARAKLQVLSSNGGSRFASLFTLQGQKGVNQDAMVVWEDFVSRNDTVFCGVFDGHGSEGHLVARKVRDMLPRTLASCWQLAAKELALSSSDDSDEGDSASEATESSSNNPFGGACWKLHAKGSAFSSSDDSDEGDSASEATESSSDNLLRDVWQESLIKAFKLMDRDLLIDDSVNCVLSGTTAVTLVKQGNDLVFGNAGDSRAVLGTRGSNGTLLAQQLTIDCKPNVQREADRIRRFKGRVFALQCEPKVKRVWLPHRFMPGLAVTRALGDYCLKNHGVISEPDVTHHRLTKSDEFVILATDGVWDVLSNEQVVKIVASTAVKSLAAKAVVENAARAWRRKHSTWKADDCAAVCLFFER